MRKLKEQIKIPKGNILCKEEYLAIPFFPENFPAIDKFLKETGKGSISREKVEEVTVYYFGKGRQRLKKGNYIRIDKNYNVSFINSLQNVNIFTNYGYFEIY